MKTTNQELSNLIEASIVDGKITKKEKAAIIKKAESLGIDKDEIEIILEAELHKLGYKKGNLEWENFNQDNILIIFIVIGVLTGLIAFEINCYTHDKEWYKYLFYIIGGPIIGGLLGTVVYFVFFLTKIARKEDFILKHILIIVGIFLIFISYIIYPFQDYSESNSESNVEISESKTLKEKPRTIDEALSIFDFETARKLVDNIPVETGAYWYIYSENAMAMFQIITTESAYLVSIKEYDKAIRVINELTPLLSKLNGDVPDNLNNYIDDIIDQCINSLIKDSKFEKAKILTIDYKNEVNGIKALKRINQFEK